MRERNVLCLLVLGASIAVVQPKNAQKLQGKKKFLCKGGVFFLQKNSKVVHDAKIRKKLNKIYMLLRITKTDENNFL